MLRASASRARRGAAQRVKVHCGDSAAQFLHVGTRYRVRLWWSNNEFWSEIHEADRPCSDHTACGMSYERAKGTGGEVGAIPTTSVAANGRSPIAGAFPKWFTLPVFETSQ
jgi:hypothetical protein